MNEKINNKFLAIFIAISFSIITLFCIFCIGLSKVEAKTLSLNDNQFAFTWGTYDSVPTSFNWLTAGQTQQRELHVMKIYDPDTDVLEGYNYIVMEFCAGTISVIKEANISNTNYNTDFITDGTGQTYITTNTCTNGSYTGTVIKKQFQVGRWTDDGDGVAYARAYLNIKNTLSYNTFLRLNNIYLSDTDEISSLSENQQNTQDIVDKIEDAADDVIQSQQQVQAAINANNNANTDKITQNQDKNQQQTNERLDDIEDAITDDTAPNLDAFDNMSGWLPPGPLDSVLNIPLNILNGLVGAFNNNSCSAISIPLPYIGGSLELPCLYNLYSSINGLSIALTTFFTAIAGYLMFKYLSNLYVWIDQTLKMEENSYMRDWGGV